MLIQLIRLLYVQHIGQTQCLTQEDRAGFFLDEHRRLGRRKHLTPHCCLDLLRLKHATVQRVLQFACGACDAMRFARGRCGFEGQHRGA